jgi:hypothetical protein
MTRKHPQRGKDGQDICKLWGDYRGVFGNVWDDLCLSSGLDFRMFIMFKLPHRVAVYLKTFVERDGIGTIWSSLSGCLGTCLWLVSLSISLSIL